MPEKKNIELLIFPELALTGYVCRDLFYQLAEPLSGSTVKSLQRAAQQNGLAIIFGMPTKGNLKGIIYNSSVLMDEGGDIYSYNKIFLPTHSIFDEKRYFRCGQEINCFETGRFKIGLTICYDIYFPEIYRILALEGADIVACISASPSTRQDYSYQP
jgi:predicted amidohydrolase